MEDCPDGELTKEQFVEMYNRIFPGGRADRFSEIIFRTFDADRSGTIDFRYLSRLWRIDKLTNLNSLFYVPFYEFNIPSSENSCWPYMSHHLEQLRKNFLGHSKCKFMHLI